MTPEAHRRVKELFQRAEELAPAEREVFLAQASGEGENVIREVRRLLEVAAETPGDFLSPAADGSTIAPGRRLGPYEIVAPLGAGGMGEVWRARDLRLGREVAVKVLPPEHGLHPGRRARFEREARAVAALSHPNIVALYDLGQSEGLAYAVTELLEGRTLRQRLEESAVSETEALDWAIQIARGLAAAHERGIVHRDLKPENVFVTADGRVKLLDFGIASWRSQSGPLDTDPGTLLGTPSYMSPEQVRGHRADHRSDLFALGCLLYEMLSGRRAFPGEAAGEVLAAVLKDEPPPLTGAGDALTRITRRCLAKDPAERFQSAGDLASHLQAAREERSAAGGRRRVVWVALAAAGVAAAAWIGASRQRVAIDAPPAAGTPPPRSSRLMLAVLPFESIGGDPEQERFADGMTEEMITVLGRLGRDRLGVIARTSAMQFKGQKATVETIGRRLGVEYVIEGSVRRQGDRVRVSAKLIQVSDQTQLWSESFDGSLGDVLGLQGDVARQIAGALSVELGPGFRLGPRTTDPRAYDAYLAGRVSFHKASEEGWRRAIGYYEEAVGREPGFALAHAAIASGYTVWALWGTTPPANARARATAAVARARELDPELAEVHSTLAVIRMFFEWEWEDAEREFRRAMALNPSDGELYHWYAHYLLFVGRPEAAVDAFTEARRFDPLSPFHRACLGGHYVAMGDLDRAEPLLRGVLEQAPESPLAHHFLGWLHERRGRIGDAVASWEQAARVSDIPNLVSTQAYGYARAGRLADAHRVRGELERRAQRGYVASLDRAKVYAGLGQRDEAFAWLEKAYRDHDAWLAALKLEPGFDAVRDDPRFGALLRRIGVVP
jgi:eukaryotic-like serine/threonine-protein kinase